MLRSGRGDVAGSTTLVGNTVSGEIAEVPGGSSQGETPDSPAAPFNRPSNPIKLSVGVCAAGRMHLWHLRSATLASCFRSSVQIAGIWAAAPNLQSNPLSSEAQTEIPAYWQENPNFGDIDREEASVHHSFPFTLRNHLPRDGHLWCRQTLPTGSRDFDQKRVFCHANTFCCVIWFLHFLAASVCLEDENFWNEPWPWFSRPMDGALSTLATRRSVGSTVTSNSTGGGWGSAPDVRGERARVREHSPRDAGPLSTRLPP